MTETDTVVDTDFYPAEDNPSAFVTLKGPLLTELLTEDVLVDKQEKKESQLLNAGKTETCVDIPSSQLRFSQELITDLLIRVDKLDKQLRNIGFPNLPKTETCIDVELVEENSPPSKSPDKLLDEQTEGIDQNLFHGGKTKTSINVDSVPNIPSFLSPASQELFRELLHNIRHFGTQMKNTRLQKTETCIDVDPAELNSPQSTPQGVLISELMAKVKQLDQHLESVESNFSKMSDTITGVDAWAEGIANSLPSASIDPVITELIAEAEQLDRQMKALKMALELHLLRIDAEVDSTLHRRENVSFSDAERIRRDTRLFQYYFDLIFNEDVGNHPFKRLVVEDNERAAKADGVKTKDPPHHVNGDLAHRSIPHHVARSKYTAPRPYPPPFHVPGVPVYPRFVHAGDSVDASPNVPVVKTKLKSFDEHARSEVYYHDAGYLKSEIYGIPMGASNEPMEKDDEGEHPGEDIKPLRNESKEGSSLFVQLSQKPQCTGPTAAVQDPRVGHETEKPTENPDNEKPMNNNKYDEEVETSCAVDCLYYTLQCCDCSIM